MLRRWTASDNLWLGPKGAAGAPPFWNFSPCTPGNYGVTVLAVDSACSKCGGTGFSGLGTGNPYGQCMSCIGAWRAWEQTSPAMGDAEDVVLARIKEVTEAAAQHREDTITKRLAELGWATPPTVERLRGDLDKALERVRSLEQEAYQARAQATHLSEHLTDLKSKQDAVTWDLKDQLATARAEVTDLTEERDELEVILDDTEADLKDEQALCARHVQEIARLHAAPLPEGVVSEAQAERLRSEARTWKALAIEREKDWQHYSGLVRVPSGCECSGCARHREGRAGRAALWAMVSIVVTMAWLFGAQVGVSCQTWYQQNYPLQAGNSVSFADVLIGQPPASPEVPRVRAPAIPVITTYGSDVSPLDSSSLPEGWVLPEESGR